LSKNKDIIPAGNSALSTKEEIPEWLRSQIGHQEGMENVEQGDILIPRLGLCQALSPQKRKSHAAYIEGLNEGDLFNTVTQEIYGKEITIVSLFFFKNRIKYIDIDDGGGIDCISANGIDGGRISPDGCSICKFSTWGNGEKDDEHGNDAPLCTLYHNFMAFIPKENSPIAISYKSTGLKLSKQLLSGVRMTRLPMYAKYWKVTVVDMRSGDNEWFEKKVIPGGFVEPELFESMKSNFEALKAANIKVDTTGEEEGDASFDHGNNSETEL
jgi:hypothetical protein